MSIQKVLVDKDNFLEWRFRGDDDLSFLGEQVYEELKNSGEYATSTDDVLQENTNYVPMHCINNWEDLTLSKVDKEDEELYIGDERFEFELEEDVA